ncbi:UDP-glycosyltransferase UGT5-like [Planococcus citri]|uniref:UDP-glycosyltransferase UGT5-like n=1 Tax=Planococcus citri TaxID=170843 RepID=UPI0031F8FBAD
MRKSIIATLLLSCLLSRGINSSNILGLFFMPAPSHYAFVRPLLNELTNRGHNLTVFTVFADQKLANYREIHVVEGFLPVVLKENSLGETLKEISSFELLKNVIFKMIPKLKQMQQNERIMELVNSTDHYDLILTDIVHAEWYTAFAFKFTAPMINIYPNFIFPWFANYIGAGFHPAFVPILSTGVSFEMSFWERLHNTIVYMVWMTVGQYYSTIPSEELARQLFGQIPPLTEIVKNTSMTFINTYPPNYPSWALPPHVVQVGGMNIAPVEKLPENLEKFIGESENGVIVFSMGSLFKGSIHPKKLEAFLYAFSKIPYHVLWKWDGKVSPQISSNIMLSKWLPQRDILAHPKVKLLISQGGLLSINEAIYEGVPILGMPIFGDQRTNIKFLVTNGDAELLEYNEITKEIVLEKIQKLLYDPKYKTNAGLLSDVFRDRPMSPLDTAIYWTEYVIRHNGAHHLRTAAVDLSWCQFLLLDVIVFLLAVFSSVLVIVYCAMKSSLRFVRRFVCSKNSPYSNSKKKYVKHD